MNLLFINIFYISCFLVIQCNEKSIIYFYSNTESRLSPNIVELLWNLKN